MIRLTTKVRKCCAFLLFVFSRILLFPRRHLKKVFIFSHTFGVNQEYLAYGIESFLTNPISQEEVWELRMLIFAVIFIKLVAAANSSSEEIRIVEKTFPSRDFANWNPGLSRDHNIDRNF